MKELLTATRMNTLLACPRKHFYRYEIGLKAPTDSTALRFGSAWHKAMEARWTAASIGDAYAAAIADVTDLDEVTLATLSGLLAGYYHRYAEDPVATLHPETEFRHSIARSKTFDSAGKIDGLGVLKDGRLALLEHKTAGQDIAPDSDYWLRLRSNLQVLQYVDAARRLGWDVALVLYDVTRKPSIAPLAAIPERDENGAKIVVDAEGNRVFKKDGTPRETADAEKGYVVKASPETPEQFADRLAADTQERPDFYFARREVPILEADLIEFQTQRSEQAKQILSFRQAERRLTVRQQAWPRNIGAMTCRSCEFCNFCLQGTQVDATHIPAGFQIGAKHSELSVG